MRRRVLGLAVALGAIAGPLLAQPPAAPQTSPDTRPATTTTTGDTGLWFVPTAGILPARRWSLSAYRVNLDNDQGFTDVSNWPMTFAIGVRDRVELFGALTAVNRIDRDVRPLFLPGSTGGPVRGGGVVNEYPFVSDGWTGTNVGDFWIGAKFSLRSEHRQARAAFALRTMLKIPTASTESGAGTGKPDVAIDAIVSKEVNQRIELSAFGGFIVRGNPDTLRLLNGVRWGVGVGLPARQRLRLTGEVYGEAYAGDSVEVEGVRIQAVDGTFAPPSSLQKSPVNAAIGLTWLGRRGIFAGAGVGWNLRMNGRSDVGGAFNDRTGDALGFQARVGYHPGVRMFVPPPPPPPVTAPPPARPATNRPPTVRARCEPCTVEAGRVSVVTTDAVDPDGDALTYRWNAPAGRLTSPADRQTPWTAPVQEGPVPVTIVVTDTRGATATDAVTIHVIKPAIREWMFENVHFDFDRYSLRPEATRALDEAIRVLQQNTGLRIEIEGHTCNIGTAEYNLAHGDRRATAVREYLSIRGIAADRLHTVSYGEERPKHDNAREDTRRPNRRAAMVVRIQQ